MRTSRARWVNARSPIGDDIEAQFKREQRRFRIDELRFGLTALTNVYRDRMVESLEGSELGDAPRVEYRVGASMRAIGVVSEASTATFVQRRRDAAVERSDALVDGVLRASRGASRGPSSSVAACAWVAQSVEQRIRNA